MKIYTCTPIDFKGDNTFFSRDSGLCCISLNQIGIQSMAIMPGAYREDDDEKYLIRTSFKNLESPEWWSKLNIDGLIFYSWANQKYNPIAKAIKQANIKLFVNMDTGGIISPTTEFATYLNGTLTRFINKYGLFLGYPITFIKVIISLIPSYQDKGRIKHMEYADSIGTVSPIAAKRIKCFIEYYGREDISKKIRMIPHPVQKYCKYENEKKEKIILCIGRWDDPVKNLELAIDIAGFITMCKPDYKVLFIGSGEEKIQHMIQQKGFDEKGILVLGKLRHIEMIEIVKISQISLCTSFSEGSHIVSEEALCCGCSVISANTPFLPAMEYYVTNNSGQLGDYNLESLCKTLLNEVEMWENGLRSPVEISDFWCNILHGDKVVNAMMCSLNINK